MRVLPRAGNSPTTVTLKLQQALQQAFQPASKRLRRGAPKFHRAVKRALQQAFQRASKGFSQGAPQVQRALQQVFQRGRKCLSRGAPKVQRAVRRALQRTFQAASKHSLVLFRIGCGRVVDAL